MKDKSNNRGILFNNSQLGPFPMHRFKQVDKPTTLITDGIQRIDGREQAFAKVLRGDYGPAAQKEARIMHKKHPLFHSMWEMLAHYNSIADNEVITPKATIPEDPMILSRHIKRLGYFLKADIMGICRLPEYAVYSHDLQGNPIDIDYPFAIIIVLSKEYETVSASTGYDWITMPLSFEVYNRLAYMSHVIARYIRRLGYEAVAEHTAKIPVGFQVILPPLLVEAGIGELGRAGIVVNPFLGMHFKAAAVLTNLPLVPDKPIDFGLQDFCQQCEICADLCPSHSIPSGDKAMYNGYETWKLDAQSCHKFRLSNKKGTLCGRCVKVCPWTKPNTWPHNLVRWAVERSGLARKLAIKADKLLGPEKAEVNDKWWFDLNETGPK